MPPHCDSLDGPVVSAARSALDAGDLADFLSAEVRRQVELRVADLERLASLRSRSLQDERNYTEALLGLQVYSHRLYKHMQQSR